MNSIFSKPISNYVLFIFIVTVITGLILYPVVENVIILISILFIYFLLVMLLIKSLFINYIKPLNKAKNALREINDGNYRARFSHPNRNIIGDLSNEINALARGMS